MQVPLHVPDVRVLSTQRREPGHWRICVESTVAGAQCRRCGRAIRARHGWDTAVRLRHRPLFDVSVCVEIRPQR
jgi:transposase